MFSASFVTVVFLTLAAVATPLVQVKKSLITLPISRRVNATHPHHLIRNDKARARAWKTRAHGPRGGAETAIVNQPLDNKALTYIASIGVGSPPTFYDLIVDTGSSNTWVGAEQAYVRTHTSVDTGNRVSVSYGSGSFSGEEFTDTVTLGSLTIPKQSIGVASNSTGTFEGADGILGIGPVGLTQGSLSPSTDSLIPTVTDNLFANRAIKANEIGISFHPTNSLESVDGEITWGGTDSTKFTGDIKYIPLTKASPSNSFWGINQSVRYGTSTHILSTTAGIVDTGTTLILLASDAFSRYQSATRAVPDDKVGLLRLTTAQFENLQSLFFTAGGHTFELTANAQIWPRNLNSAIGGDTNSVYLIVNDIGSPSGEGFDFINGYAFLERYYSVYDTANRRVGFATTPFTFATTN